MSRRVFQHLLSCLINAVTGQVDETRIYSSRAAAAPTNGGSIPKNSADANSACSRHRPQQPVREPIVRQRDQPGLCRMPRVRCVCMKPAYQLKADSSRIAAIQKATLSTDEFGIEQKHGLFGSLEWWEQISSGRLPLHTLCGVIVDRFWGSMADWPEITVRSDGGETSHWTREVNVKEQDSLYIPGQPIEIDYVLQRHRPKSFDKGSATKLVVEIRVEPTAQTPGSYERLCAKELAQA